MSVEVDRDALHAALHAVQDVVSSRNTIPVLGNLLLQATGGRLTVTGTDLDIQASASCEAAGELSTTIERGKLLAAVGSFKPGRVKIAVQENRAVTLTLGRGKRTLATLPATDFPRRETLDEATTFAVPAAALLRLFDCCHVAQSVEETRYWLNGVLLHVRDDKLIGAATDGHRMVRAEVSLPAGAEAMPDVIVPTKAVTLLRRLLAKREGDVAIGVTTKAIEATIGTAHVVAKLVDGTFPDYSRVIPQPGKHRLVGARDAFIEPANAVASVVSAEGDKIKMRAVAIEVGAEGAEITSRDAMGASASEGMDLECEGDPIRFGVNSKYLTQVAGVFAESSRLTITLDGPRDVMRVTGDKDPDLIAVIMPMNA